MIMEEIIRSIRSWNPWWEKVWIEPFTIPRNVINNIIKVSHTRHIKDVLGVRRCGKTTLLYQMIYHLLEGGTEAGEIMFLNFDDIILNTATFEELMRAIYRLKSEIRYLFLDEVQEKEEWGRWIRKLYDLKEFEQIFISGSNASLLSEDMGRILTGRHMSFELLPFSFLEFLLMNDWNDFDRNYILARHERLLSFFDRYLVEGGFPEAIKLEPNAMQRMFSNIFNDILARDIGGKHSVDMEKMRHIAKYLLANLANPYSYRGISSGLGYSFETVERYVGFLRDAFVVYDLNLFSYKLKKQFRQNKKIYVVDNGLRNHVSFRFSQDYGRLAENLVFLELKRREREIYYWRNEKYEVDFLVRSGTEVSELIQVCWKPDRARTRNREVRGLVAACKEFGLKEGLILTHDHAGKEEDEITIKYIPLCYWLLGIDPD